MYWKLKVWEYGKIKSAEIEMAPLTLFVGDNNSGKSYLMSLLWGIQNFGVGVLLGSDEEQECKEETLFDWMRGQIAAAWENGSCMARVSEVADELQAILDKRLKRNKDYLVERIFNSQSVKIKELQIELKDLDGLFIKIESVKGIGGERDYLYFKCNRTIEYKLAFSQEDFAKLNENVNWAMTYIIFSLVLDISAGPMDVLNRIIFLPSSRTGFMLTKDIINKVGRNTAFNIGQEKVTPFSRPVNQFLDVMNDLVLDDNGSKEFNQIIEYLENGMAEGTVDINTLPNKDVFYVPEGQKEGIPFRAVSAVVTELSPLILILKHKRRLDALFYEEPEMCLHPQLQQKMAKVICRLVNKQLAMTVTTHSDIILQHINNMIRLSDREDRENICQQLGYTSDDLLSAENVKVYQLKSLTTGESVVEKLECGKNGFVIPTFNDALDKIMDEAYTIQE